MRLGNGVLCSLNHGAGGKALLKTASYCSVDTKRPKSSEEECLEAGPRRKELQMRISHSSKGRSICFKGKYSGFLIKASQEIIKANCERLSERSMC